MGMMGIKIEREKKLGEKRVVEEGMEGEGGGGCRRNEGRGVRCIEKFDAAKFHLFLAKNFQFIDELSLVQFLIIFLIFLLFIFCGPLISDKARSAGLSDSTNFAGESPGDR